VEQLQSLAAKEWLASNRYEEAICLFSAILDHDPDYVTALKNRAQCCLNLQRVDEAITDLDRAIELVPNDANLRKTIALAHLRSGQHARAVEQYNSGIRIAPQHIDMHNSLAWLLATAPNDNVRDGKRAVELATKACELTAFNNAMLVDTLAAAFAEAGDFDKAVEWQQKAIDLLDQADDKVVADFTRRLELLQSGKPGGEPVPGDSSDDEMN
jgi:tetratricopeptide (TPR) repeat protein